jgi:hypothetical protein
LNLLGILLDVSATPVPLTVFPTEGYEMSDVLAGITDFLSNPIVVGVVMLIFGFKLAPRALSALRRATGR